MVFLSSERVVYELLTALRLGEAPTVLQSTGLTALTSYTDPLWSSVRSKKGYSWYEHEPMWMKSF